VPFYDDTMSAHLERLRRVIPAERKVLIIPMDHGLVFGNITGLERPADLLSTLVASGVDGTLVSVGLARALGDLLATSGLSRTVPVDHQYFGTIPGSPGAISSVAPIVDVEQALAVGADAVKALFVWGLPDDVVQASILTAAAIAKQAQANAVPFMLEPLWFGAPLPPAEHDAIIVHASRIALELGADILKIPAVGVDALHQILAWGVPTVFLGGAKQDDPSALFNAIRSGLAAGAAGVVVGRNVWQRPDVSAAIAQIRTLL
jgi:fructose-bisphosphate aldolase, class I